MPIFFTAGVMIVRILDARYSRVSSRVMSGAKEGTENPSVTFPSSTRPKLRLVPPMSMPSVILIVSFKLSFRCLLFNKF